MDNHFDRRERTIYVWMLERSVTDDQLYSLFSKIGPIEKLIFKEYADGTPQHCLIVFRYVDSVLTAMSTLQGVELNGKPISLRPLRESTHAVLMPVSAMYPTTSSSMETTAKEHSMTVTSSDGHSDHSDDHHHKNNYYAPDKKVRANWDATSSAGSTCSGMWNTEGLEAATEKLTMDGKRGGTVGSRSGTSYSSISSGAGSPSFSLSPPLPSQQQHSVIHGSLRKPWRPSKGPIPAPLVRPDGGNFFPGTNHPHQYQHIKEENGSGGGSRHSGHTNHVHHSAGLTPTLPSSLFSHLMPSSPGFGPPSPYGKQLQQPQESSQLSGIVGGASPRPLFPDMYKPAAGRHRSSAQAAPSGVFSPTAASEEVLWRAQPLPPPPPHSSLMSPPSTSGPTSHNWFNYGEYSVPHAYRSSGTEQYFAAAYQGGEGTPPLPVSLGGMLPPNSPPIGQCTRFFDVSDGSMTLPRQRVSFPYGGDHSYLFPPPPASARPRAPSPWEEAAPPITRYAPRAPRSAASHNHHNSSPFPWPEFRPFAGRF